MTTPKIIRLSKALIVLTVGLLALVVVFGNVTDYFTNFQFVKHVLSMDNVDKVAENTIAYRAISSPAFHHFAYVCIILFEALIMILCLKGGYDMLKNLNEDGQTFHEAKKMGILGLTACCLLWFFLGFRSLQGNGLACG